MSKHSMYSENPHMEHDAHGKVHVKKEKTDKGHGMKKEENAADDMEVHTSHHMEHMHMGHRHVKERMDMHARHAEEHMQHAKMHGHEHKGEMHKRHHADMKAMHARHETEMKDMHTRHEKHAGAMGGDATSTGESVDKVEKGGE